MDRIKEDLTGMRFGHLLVIGLAERNPKYPKNRNWKLLCDCGREDFAITSVLNAKHKTTCGTCHFYTEMVHSFNKTHGKSGSKLYRVWMSMKARCKNSKDIFYKDYGGRGISVCSQWINYFESFASWASISGYKEGLSIDRIDNDSNYSPENCRWATPKEQALNRRTTRWLTYNNETKTLAEWERILGFKKTTVFRRLEHGWSIDDALSKPVRTRSYQWDTLARPAELASFTSKVEAQTHGLTGTVDAI